jgi:hypothetical protein
VLNLGVEGMMLVGAVMGFWVVQRFHAARPAVLPAAILVAALAGSVMALIHAFLVVTLRANQIVGAGADDLRGRRRALVVPGQRPQPRRQAGPSRVQPVEPVRPRDASGGRADRLRPASTGLCLVGVCAPGRALPRADAAGADGSSGGRVAGGRRCDGDQRRALSLRAHARGRRPSPAWAARASASRSRRGGSTASPPARAGSPSRSSSSPSDDRSSASRAGTSSAPSRRCRTRCRPEASRSRRSSSSRCPTLR